MTTDPGWHVTPRPDLLAGLTAPQHDLIDRVAAAAAKMGLPVFLVGGIVRDLVLNRPHGPDLDFVVSGDALALGDLIVRHEGGELARYPAFRTATWYFAGADTDLVTARRETYAHPGALPEVTPGTLLDDLYRRDFTINAMALALHDGHRGELVDPHGGEADLARGVLAVLHPQSFRDDPTRILRGLRLAARLGLSLETNTSRLIPAALPVLAGISPARLLAELEYVFAEDDAAAILSRFAAAGALEAITPGLRVAPHLSRQLATLSSDGWRGIALWFAGQPADVARAAALRLGLPREAQDLLDQTLFVQEIISNTQAALTQPSAPPDLFSDPTVPISLLHHHLSRIQRDSLVLASLITPAATNLRRYVAATDAAGPPLLTGDDLKLLGVPPGPAYKTLLAAVYDAQLDGKLHTKQQAITLAAQLAKDPPL